MYLVKKRCLKQKSLSQASNLQMYKTKQNKEMGLGLLSSRNGFLSYGLVFCPIVHLKRIKLFSGVQYWFS